MSEGMVGNLIVEGNGVYPAEGVLYFANSVAHVTLTNPCGAMVTVEGSEDDGTTWHERLPFDKAAQAGHFKYGRRHTLHLNVTRNMLLRVRVTGFVGQFSLWIE